MAVHRLAWLTCDTEGCRGTTRDIAETKTVAEVKRYKKSWWGYSLYGIPGDYCGQCVSDAATARN